MAELSHRDQNIDSKAESGEGAPLYAQVLIDLDVPHLDHPFDYSVPKNLWGRVQVGSLVQVRFAGRLTPGFVLSLAGETDFNGRVAPISRVVTPISVLSVGIIETAKYVARRYAVSLSQVLSLIVPARRASEEKKLSPEEAVSQQSSGSSGSGGPRDPSSPSGSKGPLRRVAAAVAPSQWLAVTASAAQAQADTGRTSIVMFPTAAQAQVAGDYIKRATGLKVGLSHSEMDPAHRYRSYLQMRMGKFDVMVGTRSAAWLPMPRLGGLIIWDDGSDLYRERRTPRLDTLDVGVARSHIENIDLLLASYARSVKAQYLVEQSWAASTSPSADALAPLIPKVRFFGAEEALAEGASGATRLPSAAYRLMREGLENGPVLVQVPAKGHTTEIEEDGQKTGRVRVGADRVGAELARAFPKFPVIVSSSTAGIETQVGAAPAIIVATGGAEPLTPDGYAAVIITGAAAAAYRPGMDSKVDALRRWMDALGLAAPGAKALIVGEVPSDLREAITSWQPIPLARSVLDEREMLGFAPTRWVVSIEGGEENISEVVDVVEKKFGAPQLSLPGEDRGDLAFLGRVPTNDGVRVILSVQNQLAFELMDLLASLRKKRSSSRKELFSLRVNPSDLVWE